MQKILLSPQKTPSCCSYLDQLLFCCHYCWPWVTFCKSSELRVSLLWNIPLLSALEETLLAAADTLTSQLCSDYHPPIRLHHGSTSMIWGSLHSGYLFAHKINARKAAFPTAKGNQNDGFLSELGLIGNITTPKTESEGIFFYDQGRKTRQHLPKNVCCQNPQTDRKCFCLYCTEEHQEGWGPLWVKICHP